MPDPTISSVSRTAVELAGSLTSPKRENKPVEAPKQPAKVNQATTAYGETRLQFQVDAKNQ